MPYTKHDLMTEKDTAEIREELYTAISNGSSVSAISKKAEIDCKVLISLLRGTTKRLSVVNYGKLWCALNPEK